MKGFSFLIRQCKFDGIYFVFLYHPQEQERKPIHITHIAKAPRANTATKALSKSAILPTLKISLL